jgi:hypothetical protein
MLLPEVHPKLGDIPDSQHWAAAPPEPHVPLEPAIGPTPLPAVHSPDPFAASPNGIAMGFSYFGFVSFPPQMIQCNSVPNAHLTKVP